MHRAGDDAWQYIPVCGDPQLVIVALATLIERKRGSAPAAVELPAPDGVRKLTLTPLVKLAEDAGASADEIKEAKAAAQGTHPFSLFALFKRYTTHKITERGFFTLLTTHTKVLGRGIKSSHGLLHKYADARGEIQTEVPGRHLTYCRLLRATDARDVHVIKARLAVVHTEVRVCTRCLAAALACAALVVGQC